MPHAVTTRLLIPSTGRSREMSENKHETGAVRVIPADHLHFFHEIVSYAAIPSKTIIKAVDTIHEPGRHRQFDGIWNSASAVFMISAPDSEHFGKFECPVAWDEGMAIEFKYL